MVKKKEMKKKKGTLKKKVTKKATKKKIVAAKPKSKAKEKLMKTVKKEKKIPKTSDRTVKLAELKKKAAELARKIEGVETRELKEEVKKKKKTLVALEDYVKTGIHLGTKVITPTMRKFVYRRRADGIAVLNTNLIDEYLRKAVEFMANFEPEEIILICKREAGWRAAELFSEATGVRVFTKKYPVGMMTNLKLEEFFEPELVIITDPWIDKNALKEAVKTNKKTIILCDTNNFTRGADVVVPCNNKAGKSLGLIFYILAREYLKAKKLKTKLPEMDEFVGED